MHLLVDLAQKVKTPKPEDVQQKKRKKKASQVKN
jgi:hypothetical protein